MQTEAQDELLTPEEAADLLKVSKRTMYEWLRNSVIPSERIGDRLIRVRRKDVLTPDVKSHFEQGCQLAQSPETMWNAEDCFRQAVKLNPRYALAYATWGSYLGYWGRHFQAIQPLEKAVEMNPNFINYANLGHAYRGAQIYSKSVKSLRSALEVRTQNLEPSHLAHIHAEIGFALFMVAIGLYDHEQVEKYNEAIEQCRKSLEIEKNWKAAHFMADAYIKLSDYEKALSVADEIQEAFPHESDNIRQRVSFFTGTRKEDENY